MNNKEWNGNSVDTKIIKEIVEYFSTEFQNPNLLFKRKVYSILTELVSNVLNHAYENNFQDTKWNIRLEKKIDTFTLSISDNGITIPVSINRKIEDKHIFNDNDLIKESIVKEMINPENRGKGLKLLIKLCDSQTFSSFQIKSRNGNITYQSNEFNYSSEINNYEGTMIELVFNHSQIEIIEIKFANVFSETPGGRYRKEGPNSGQAFREDIIEPYLDNNPNIKIKIDFDGTYGFAFSFLEEVFGGLARKYGKERILSAIEIICTAEPYLIFDIEEYIKKTI